MLTEVQNGILRCITILRTKLLFVRTMLWWDRKGFLGSKKPESGRLKVRVYKINYRVIHLRALSLPTGYKYNRLAGDRTPASIRVEHTILLLHSSSITALDLRMVGPWEKAFQNRIREATGLMRVFTSKTVPKCHMRHSKRRVGLCRKSWVLQQGK